jgi:hypothetical protein
MATTASATNSAVTELLEWLAQQQHSEVTRHRLARKAAELLVVMLQQPAEESQRLWGRSEKAPKSLIETWAVQVAYPQTRVLRLIRWVPDSPLFTYVQPDLVGKAEWVNPYACLPDTTLRVKPVPGHCGPACKGAAATHPHAHTAATPSCRAPANFCCLGCCGAARSSSRWSTPSPATRRAPVLAQATAEAAAAPASRRLPKKHLLQRRPAHCHRRRGGSCSYNPHLHQLQLRRLLHRWLCKAACRSHCHQLPRSTCPGGSAASW